MNRRGFCINACQIASLFALGTSLDGCGGSPTSPSGSAPLPLLTAINGSVGNGAVTVNIGSGSVLATVGNAALVQSNAGSFLVARVGQDAFNAMTATCTHEACTIQNFGNQTFECECHGSQFNTAGNVVRGPASRSLQRFTTSFAGNVLTMSL